LTSLCTIRFGEEGRLCMNLVQIVITAHKNMLYNEWVFRPNARHERLTRFETVT